MNTNPGRVLTAANEALNREYVRQLEEWAASRDDPQYGPDVEHEAPEELEGADKPVGTERAKVRAPRDRQMRQPRRDR